MYQVRSGDGQSGPWTYTVGPDESVFDTWTFGAGATYDLSVYGPNGFFRGFQGGVSPSAGDLAVAVSYDREPGITLEILNRGAGPVRLQIDDGYAGGAVHLVLEPGKRVAWHWSPQSSFGWYDLTVRVDCDPTFRRQVAGHVETGRESMTDPAIGR